MICVRGKDLSLGALGYVWATRTGLARGSAGWNAVLYTESLRIQFPVREHGLYHHEPLRTNIFCNFLRFHRWGPIGLNNNLKTLSSHYLWWLYNIKLCKTEFYNSNIFCNNKQNDKPNLENRSEPGGNTWGQPAEDIKELWVSVSTVFKKAVSF